MTTLAAVPEQNGWLARARGRLAALWSGASENAQPAPIGRRTGTAFAAVAISIGLVTLWLDQSGAPLQVRLALVALAVLPWLPAGPVMVPLTMRGALTVLPAAALYLLGDQFAAMLIVLAVTSVISHGRYALALPTLAVGVGTIAAGAALHRGVLAVFWAGGIALGVVSGWSMRTQRRLMRDLQAARAELERAALVEERRRIARDVHDLIAHSLTVVMLHLTAARLALKRDVEEASATLTEAERLGREALSEVRSLVGLLRRDDPVEPRGSVPRAGDLRQLVDRLREAGMAIELRIDGQLERLSAAAGLVVYRVGQEALSNAARHAPGAHVKVRLEVSSGEARLSVRDWGRTATESLNAASAVGGHGLDGMRERVALVGGLLRAGPALPGWEVECLLPI